MVVLQFTNLLISLLLLSINNPQTMTVAVADPLENEMATNFTIHPLYYVIVGLLVLIFIVCCGLFCWVYSSHNRTQKMIAAQQRRLDSRSFNIYTSDGRDGHHGHLHLPSTRMSMNGELVRTDSNHNHNHKKTTTFEKSKSPSYDIKYTIDTDMRSPTNTNISRYSSAAPRVYRLQSAEVTNLLPENGIKLTTAKANLPKFDQKKQQQVSCFYGVFMFSCFMLNMSCLYSKRK